MRPVCGRREVAKGPRCARSAFPARTLTRGCQAAARLLRSAAALRVTAAGERAGSPCGPAGRLALIQQNEAQQHRGAAPLSRTTAAADARGARTERTGQAPSPALDLEKAGTTAAWAVTARRRPVCERFRSYSARRPGGAVRGRGPAAGLRNAGASWSHGGASPRPRGGESHALTTLLRRLLGVTQLYVERVQFPAAGRLSVAVRPSWRRSRCGTCGRRAPLRPAAGARLAPPAVGPGDGVAAVCAVAGIMPSLRGAGRTGLVGRERQRVHGVVRGDGCVSGADHGSDGGQPSDGHLVAGGRQHRRAGGGAATRSGAVHGLKRIGVDEFSYRRRRHYLTVVVDHDRRRVVWAGKGRSAETLEAFFDRLGPAAANGSSW